MTATLQGRGRILLRFVLFLLPLQALVGAAAGWYALRIQRENVEADLLLHAEQTARYMSASVDDALTDGDAQSLRSFVDRRCDDFVLRCAVCDASGQPLHDSPAGAPSDRLVSRVARARAAGALVTARDPALGVLWAAIPVPPPARPDARPNRGPPTGSAPRAFAYAEISTERYDHAVDDLAWQIAGATAAFVAVAALAAIALARHVTRPVTDLARAAERIALGDLDVRCGVDRADEIGALAASFDLMVEQVRLVDGELREARDFLDAVIESMPDAVVLVSGPGRGRSAWSIVRANRAAGAVAGTEPSALHGQELSALFADPAAARWVVERLSEDGAVRGYDAEWASRDGRCVEVRISASSVLTADASPSGAGTFVVVASDVTRLRQAERRRAASYLLAGTVHSMPDTGRLLASVEDVLREVLPMAGFHVALLDPESGTPRIARWSAGGGLPPETECSTGLTAWALGTEATVLLTETQIRLMIRRGDVQFEGAPPAWWAGVPIRLGQQSLGLVVLQGDRDDDVPDPAALEIVGFAGEQMAVALGRLRTEAERVRLSAAVEAAADAVVVADHDGRILYANPAFGRLTGWPDGVACGLTMRDVWSSGGSTGLAAAWRAVGRDRPWTGRIECRRRDRTTFTADCALAVVPPLPSDPVERFVAVLHDMTHELALSDQLLHAQKMEAVGVLAGGIAHDFNNLLSVIVGYGEILDAHLTDPAQRTCLAQIRRAGERAATLVQQLLASSRRQVRKPRRLDVGALVHDMHAMLLRVIGEDVEFVTDVAPQLAEVEADPDQIEQVVMNLVVNARDAMPSGGTLTVSAHGESVTAPCPPDLRDLRPGPYVVLSVEDTGTGIPPEIAERIFEPFFTTKAKGEGTGLGLSTVHGIVHQSGGEIVVRSAPGAGTEFRVYLPALTVRPDPTGAVTTAALVLGGTETILVAEDEEGVREFVRYVLEDAGYRVVAAENGPRALELARVAPERIDLLLSDVVMPRMSGRVLADTLRAEGLVSRVLFMSGYPDRAVALRGNVDASTDLLQKPLTRAQLLQRVRLALDREPAPAA